MRKANVTFRLFLVGILVSLVLSCASMKTNEVFDDTVPIEKTALIMTSLIGTVTAYNGIPVHWEAHQTTGGYVQIPAGDTLLEIDMDTGATKMKGVLFQYNFQPQKQYIFKFAIQKDDTYGFNLYAYDYGEKMTASVKDFQAHFLEFVPFLNSPNKGKTVLD